MKNKNEITEVEAVMCFGVIAVIVGVCIYSIFHKFTTAQEYSNMAGIMALLFCPFLIYGYIKVRPKKKSNNNVANVQNNVPPAQEQPNYEFNNRIMELNGLSRTFIEEINQARKNNRVWNWEHSVYEYLSYQDEEIICKVVGCWVKNTVDGKGSLFYVNQNHERWQGW